MSITITGTNLLTPAAIRALQARAAAIAEEQAQALFRFACDTARDAWDNKGTCLVTADERDDFAVHLPNLTTEAHEAWLMRLLHAATISNDAYDEWELDPSPAGRSDMTDADATLLHLCHKALALNAEAATTPAGAVSTTRPAPAAHNTPEGATR